MSESYENGWKAESAIWLQSSPGSKLPAR